MSSANLKTQLLFEFDLEELLQLGTRLTPEYASADPFPHVVIDDFLPVDVLDHVLAEWPDFETTEWTVYDNDRELKHVCSDLDRLGPATQGLLQGFNSSAFVRFIQVLTGITPLLVDPHFRAAGIFDVQPGGFLDLHTDFTECPHEFSESAWIPGFWDRYAGGTGLARRVNALLYLNREWTEDDGGALELWRTKPFECVQSVAPLFNRLVVFSTLPDAVHGHPEPVAVDAPGSRKCLSTYFYTKERPLREIMYGSHAVMFDEGDKAPQPGHRRSAVSALLLPPIAWRGLRRVKSRLRPG